MTAPSHEETRVAAITTGLDRFKRSLRAGARTARPYRFREPVWAPALVAGEETSPSVTADMADFGYLPHECHGRPDIPDTLAMTGPVALLTPEGSQSLRQIGQALKGSAVHNDYVVSHRIRNVETVSPFVHAMVRDTVFLRRVSTLVGVPLIPHPLRDAGVQVNYYEPPSAGMRTAPVAKWHRDGMNYVFTMTLSDRDEYEGGDYIYYQGRPEDFDAHRNEVTSAGSHHPDVRTAPFRRVGDTMFTRGSRVYHAVTPVTRGHRITLAVSLFCPLLGKQDENRFWHSAPDDGLLRTVNNWRHLHQAIRRPASYCRREGIPILRAPSSH
ncbi:2OG-Fe(II) oxygenase superfamily protein [Streptomyces sp. MnatMP-M77]|nr:2OG-Fe(II) oxygenase superfamily protein [Streptomyces sp. MnatMP-M77]